MPLFAASALRGTVDNSSTSQVELLRLLFGFTCLILPVLQQNLQFILKFDTYEAICRFQYLWWPMNVFGC